MLDTDFEQLNLRDMAYFKKFSFYDQTQLDVPEFHRTMPAHCPPPYITLPERMAYLERRDKALTNLEAWLSYRLAHEKRTINQTEDIEMRVAAGLRGLAIYDTIKELERLKG